LHAAATLSVGSGPLLLVAIPAKSPRRWGRLGQQGGEDGTHEAGRRSLLRLP
jgi:hypothetical protein